MHRLFFETPFVSGVILANVLIASPHQTSVQMSNGAGFLPSLLKAEKDIFPVTATINGIDCYSAHFFYEDTDESVYFFDAKFRNGMDFLAITIMVRILLHCRSYSDHIENLYFDNNGNIQTNTVLTLHGFSSCTNRAFSNCSHINGAFSQSISSGNLLLRSGVRHLTSKQLLTIEAQSLANRTPPLTATIDRKTLSSAE